MTIDECVRALCEKLGWTYKIQLPDLDGGFSRSFDPLGYAEDSERLLEAMPGVRLEFIPDSFYLSGKVKTPAHWICFYGFHQRPPSADRDKAFVWHDNRRMAIFLAALKWQGIEEPKENER